MESREYVRTVLARLGRRYGRRPRTKLLHKSITELFVAVLLSPQCNDNQVNRATPRLFRRFRGFGDYASADIDDLTGYLSGLNYYRTKARNLKRAAAMLESRFHGRVPRTIKELMELPGVGRKVANVILNEGYGIDQGIAVDTHCGRVAVRLGLSRHAGKPDKIERDLLRKIPEKEGGRTSNLFIELGRDACKARNRECGRCVLRDICPSSLWLAPSGNCAATSSMR